MEKNQQPVSVRFRPGYLALVDETAVADRRTRTWVINEALRVYLTLRRKLKVKRAAK